jgi:hypothetical protein
MRLEVQPRDHGRRNRLIAIIAGTITVTAIVLGFAGDFLGLPWHWMRPAAELLLLAELVGLVVLERHQLLEPVHEKVGGIDERTNRIDTKLDTVLERLTESGRTTICTSPPEVYRLITRITRDALARDHDAPQVLRFAALSGRAMAGEPWELEAETKDFAEVFASYLLLPNSKPDSRARRWSLRMMPVFAETENFERWWSRLVPLISQKPINLETKFVVRAPTQAQLSPQVITDNNVLLCMDDRTSVFHWGLLLEGRQHAALFAQWFDELWSDLPGAHLVYSRTGLDQEELDAFRHELAEAEAAAKKRRPS